MPQPAQTLNEAQKDIIQGIVTDLLDFSAEEKALGAEIVQLGLALEEKTLEENHDYAQLQKCYRDPTAWFLRLESHNPDISIGLVQEYILDCLNDLIKKAAPAGTTPSSLGWNRELHLAKLQKPQPGQAENETAYSLPFRSQSSRFDFDNGYHPWQIQVPSERMYNIELLQQPEFRQFSVLIHVDLPDSKPFDGETVEYPSDVQTDADEDQFVLRQHAAIQETVQTRVVQILLDHLVTINQITPEERPLVQAGPQFLLLHRSYFKAVAEGRIPFRAIKEVDIYETDVLLDPGIISLIDAGICDIATALTLTPAEVQVCTTPHYSQCLLEGSLPFSDLRGVTVNKANLLTLPSMIYLQHKNKITYREIRNTPSWCAPIFKNPLCLQMFESGKLPLDRIRQLSKQKAVLLANQYYANEVFQERLSLDELDQWSDDEVDNLLHPALIELQKKGRLTREAAKCATPSTCRLLKDDYYFSLALQGKIDFTFLQALSPEQVTYFLMPKIKKLFQRDKLDLASAVQLGEREWRLLTQKAIYNLYFSGKIQLKDLGEIPDTLAALLGAKKFLYEMIMQDVFPLRDCLDSILQGESANEPFTEFALHYGGRLIGLFNNKTYYHAATKDTLSRVHENLESQSKNNSSIKPYLQGRVLRVFLLYLQRDTFSREENFQNADSFYSRFLAALPLPDETLLVSNDPAFILRYLEQFNELVDNVKQRLAPFETKPEARSTRKALPALSIFAPSRPEEDQERLRSFYAKISKAAMLVNSFGKKSQPALSLTA